LSPSAFDVEPEGGVQTPGAFATDRGRGGLTPSAFADELGAIVPQIAGRRAEGEQLPVRGTSTCTGTHQAT
jgi:hypothetical protein